MDNEIGCDVSNGDQVQGLFETSRIHGIVHLAAILPTAAQREPLLATQVNVYGSLHLLEMARRFGVRRFVFGSSLSVYGTYPVGQVVSELDRASPEDVYGTAKLYVERLGEAYRQAHGIEFVSLRIGRVVGAGAASVTSAWRSQIFELLGAPDGGEIRLPYSGSETLLVAHADDVARMLAELLLAMQPAHGVYNAVCEPVVVDDLKREVERLNPRVLVALGGQKALGNPRALDCSRFAGEFRFRSGSLFEQMAKVAGGGAA